MVYFPGGISIATRSHMFSMSTSSKSQLIEEIANECEIIKEGIQVKLFLRISKFGLLILFIELLTTFVFRLPLFSSRNHAICRSPTCDVSWFVCKLFAAKSLRTTLTQPQSTHWMMLQDQGTNREKLVSEEVFIFEMG